MVGMVIFLASIVMLVAVDKVSAPATVDDPCIILCLDWEEGVVSGLHSARNLDWAVHICFGPPLCCTQWGSGLRHSGSHLPLQLRIRLLMAVSKGFVIQNGGFIQCFASWLAQLLAKHCIQLCKAANPAVTSSFVPKSIVALVFIEACTVAYIKVMLFVVSIYAI